MDVDQQQQQQHSPFASSDAHFSPQPQIQPQQSPSQSQRQQPHQQQQHRPSPESPSQSLSQSHIQNQGQSQGQNQWQSAQQHPHILTLSLPVSGSLSTVSASPTSYSPASAHPADGYPFYAQQPQAQSQSQVPGADGGHHGHSHSRAHQGMERSASLSLNISSLSVQSPATLSPLTPSPHPSTASTTQTLSPVTPLSPSTTPHAQHYQTQTTPSNRHPGQGQGQGVMFAYAPPPEIPYSTSGPYDTSASTPAVTLPAYARAPSSRSSSAASTALSTKSSIPRKRSFTNAASLPVSTLGLDESGSVPGYNPALGQSAHDLASSTFDDVDVDLYSGSGGLDNLDGRGGGGSPGDGGDSSSGDGDEDPFKSLSLGVGSNHNGSGTGLGGLSSLSIPQQGGGYGGPVSAKSTGTNNFVTKLYQMINDPKSTMFIQWTELGTSFVVSNVGEFSRTILGAHFKHNNFSSFVRQLNMYGFHKINRGRQTPRGTRASGSGQTSAGSTDQQVWEFSHHKFLRGRPDLLDEIKRKALDPDPAIKQRVELPGELAAQLGQMRENHRRVVRALEWERTKVDRLVGVMRGLYDVVGRAFPGSVPPFPPELWETPENNPPIFVTSPSAPSPGPTSARAYGAYGSANGVTTNGMTLPSSFPNLQPFSPGSSPTGSEFTHTGHAGHYAHPMHHGHHGHAGHQHHLNRAHSMQNIPYDSSFAAPSPISAGPRYDDPMDLDGSGMGLNDRKRQRTGPGLVLGSMEGKRLSRARSDSAPLGYGVWGTGGASGTVGRPRSGSGLAQANARAAAATPHASGRRDDLMVNISNVGNGKGTGQQGQGQSVTSPLVPKASG